MVLVDLHTLQTYEYKFNVSELVKVPKADELEFGGHEELKHNLIIDAEEAD